MAYEDAGHRPHGIHTGEVPELYIDRGPYGISVTLDTWGPQENLFTTMYDALQSNWGDAPNRSALQPCRKSSMAEHGSGPKWDGHDVTHEMDCLTGWCQLTDGQRDYVESCFAGKTLPQILELLSFEFTVDGVSRAFTHQYVRTRIGAGFMQHGGRDNDWRHRRWTMPETMARMCDHMASADAAGDDVGEHDSGSPLKHCITNWEPVIRLLSDWADIPGLGGSNADIKDAIETYLKLGRELYAAIVDAGIPWQDARRLLHIGTQTYIHSIYNYLALQGVCNKRLEFAMDWEINCVAQLMVREVRMKCHPLLGKYLQSLSDKLGIEAYAGLESWTPSGKYENPFEVCEICEFKKDHINHTPEGKQKYGEQFGHSYRPKDSRPRTHRPEQSPFWVLHPDSMAGGPIKWIPTNGKFPTEW